MYVSFSISDPFILFPCVLVTMVTVAQTGPLVRESGLISGAERTAEGQPGLQRAL